MNISIKYMVSLRCKMVVQEELDYAGIRYRSIQLGRVDLIDALTQTQHDALKIRLLTYGLELLDDKEAMLIESIKNTVVEMIHYAEELPRENYSYHISQALNYDYTYLSNLFSRVTGITIQQYIIQHRVEKVKELILYDELNMTEISYKLQFSSVAHLSNQFKKITGLTPSEFKKLIDKKMVNIESI